MKNKIAVITDRKHEYDLAVLDSKKNKGDKFIWVYDMSQVYGNEFSRRILGGGNFSGRKLLIEAVDERMRTR